MQKITRIIILSVGIIILLSIFIHNSYSIPEFSILTGNKCSSCHINYQGGGMRKNFGWQFGKDVSNFHPEELYVNSIYDFTDKSGYYLIDSLLALGTDFRYQSARSHKYSDAVRKYFPMQASFYINLNIIKEIQFEGQYNFGKKVFPGQQEWAFSVIYDPGYSLPILRVGHFMPAMGLRDCDMTMLDRRISTPDGSETIIPPDFAEHGIEVIYDNQPWMTLSSGMFDSRNLAENRFFGNSTPLVSVFHNPSFTFRAAIFPEWAFDWAPNSILGGSVLINGNFNYSTAFFAISINDDLQLHARYSHISKPNVRSANNFIGGLSYILSKGIIAGLRAEKGFTNIFIENAENTTISTTQYVANAKILLLPYIEFIPEYRYLITDEYKSFRWALQFHFYY